jgi:NO-binding membrane sensor protein with MHYT domain
MNPGDVVSPVYQPFLVACSFFMSFFGCFAALRCTQYIFRKDGTVDRSMAFYAAVALGGIGVWSMHFIGMLGYQLPLTVQFEGVWTILSLLAAILIVGLGLLLAGWRGQFSYARWIAASLIVGVGAVVMHYLGMYAMRMRASMQFDTTIVAYSVAIAIVAAAAALWLAFNIQRGTQKIVAAFVMALAVCAMHYTGMASANLVCTAATVGGGWIVSGEYVGLIAFALTALILSRLGYVLSARWYANQAQPVSA